MKWKIADVQWHKIVLNEFNFSASTYTEVNIG